MVKLMALHFSTNTSTITLAVAWPGNALSTAAEGPKFGGSYTGCTTFVHMSRYVRYVGEIKYNN